MSFAKSDPSRLLHFCIQFLVSPGHVRVFGPAAFAITEPSALLELFIKTLIKGFRRCGRVNRPHLPGPSFTRMTVGQLLGDIRDRYLTEFRECIAYVKENGMEAMCEAAYRDEDGALTREGTLNFPMRLDVVGVADGEAKDTLRVDSDSMLSFEPIDFE
jgi:hypothetical protein